MNFISWHSHFLANGNHFDHIEWHYPYKLSQDEKCLIYSSIQQFQRGESSEGIQLINFAAELKDPSYIDAMKAFIIEEQSHARALGRFMLQQGIPKITYNKADAIFRKVRRLFGLEHAIKVLLSAELIAVAFYDALSLATFSPVLSQICKQILEDEHHHIQFQSEALRILYHRKWITGKLWFHFTRRIMLEVAILAVWHQHKSIFRKSGYTIRRFKATSRKSYFRSRKIITGMSKAASPSMQRNKLNHKFV